MLEIFMFQARIGQPFPEGSRSTGPLKRPPPSSRCQDFGPEIVTLSGKNKTDGFRLIRKYIVER